jgi:hypothetical protein
MDERSFRMMAKARPNVMAATRAARCPRSCINGIAAMETYCRIDFFVSPRLMPRQYVIETNKLYRLMV